MTNHILNAILISCISTHIKRVLTKALLLSIMIRKPVMVMLNDRKLKILEAIINDYILTAEPIGSRTIAKKYNMGISSATIRNEMSDLEEMGFIIQPHASAGRVPSDKGYRLYVDSLMQSRELTQEQIDFINNIIFNNINQIDYLMKETAKAIAFLTNYTTIVSEPSISKTKIKHLQVLPLDENAILLVVITDSKAVKNKILKVKDVPNTDALLMISNILNNKLSNVEPSKINNELLEDLKNDLGEYGYMALAIIESILNIVSYEENRQIYTSGVKNILAFPEFSDLDKARALFNALEEKDVLITLLDNDGGESIKIVIGSENDVEHMQGCSIIKANYNFGDQAHGSIGIIGPTRMDYPQVVAVLNGIVKNINRLLYSIL